MVTPANIDARKLKDQAAELLGKHKYAKAAELLEQLARAEPRDMQHRFKLGDTYRRLNQTERAINAYQIAGRHFADEGQLLKAIGAFKVILEIDPKNEGAQRDLAQMNVRRFAKNDGETHGLISPKALGATPRAASHAPPVEPPQGAPGFDGGHNALEMTADDLAPLELDESDAGFQPGLKGSTPERLPSSSGTAKPAAARPPTLEPRRGPPPVLRPAHQLGSSPGSAPGSAPAASMPAAPTPARGSSREPELELSGDLDALEPLDVDMPAPAKSASGAKTAPAASPAKSTPASTQAPWPHAAPPAAVSAGRSEWDDPQGIELDPDADLDDELAELDVELPKPAAPATRPGASTPSWTIAPKPAAPIPVLAPSTAPQSSAGWKPPPRPIADLLRAASDEDEIELISITSSNEPVRIPSSESGRADNLAAPAPERLLPAKVPLFDDLPQDAFVALCNRLNYKRRAPGEVILRQGDLGRSFFVIVDGKVRIYKTRADGVEVGLARLGAGAFFGEMAILSGAPRAASVVAEEETELLEISDQALREIVGVYPSVAQSLKNFYRQRLVNNVMSTSPMFNEFDPMERRSIVERFRMKQATAGEVLIHEGQRSDGLYVVLFGDIRVTKKVADGKQVELARLKEGELFGEMSLLTHDTASATVTARDTAIVLKLPDAEFQELILTHPQILELVSDLTDKRRSEQVAVLSGQGDGHDGMSFV